MGDCPCVGGRHVRIDSRLEYAFFDRIRHKEWMMKLKITIAAAGFATCLFGSHAFAYDGVETARWTSAWASPQSDAFFSVSLINRTLRQVVTAHQDGHTVRVRLSNLYGTQPVKLGEVQIGLSAGDAAVVPGSSRLLRFHGQSGLTLQPGDRVWSDPIDLDVLPMQRLTLSMYAPGWVRALSRHYFAAEYSWLAFGNQAAAEDARNFARINNPLEQSWALVDGVDVLTTQAGRVVVAFGDSITDGADPDPRFPLATNKAAIGHDTRWPDFLSRRLISANKHVSVVDAGIGGNKLLSGPALPVFGEQGTKRLQRDVIDVSGVTDAILLIGINDLGDASQPSSTALIAGLQETALRLKRAGIRVIMGTLTPVGNSDLGKMHGRASVEFARQEINQWIRTSGVADAVADFDASVRDPRNPSILRADYDSGDHLHPNAKGHEAMAACVDLALF